MSKLMVSSKFIVLHYRYVILDWQNGSNRLQHRHRLEHDVEQVLIWHQRCIKILAVPEQSNMTFTVSAFFCGNYCQKDTIWRWYRYWLYVCWQNSDLLEKMWTYLQRLNLSDNLEINIIHLSFSEILKSWRIIQLYFFINVNFTYLNWCNPVHQFTIKLSYRYLCL